MTEKVGWRDISRVQLDLTKSAIQILLSAIFVKIRQAGSGWGVSWLEHKVGDPGDRVQIPVTAITFSRAAIHFPTVYNLQCHQRPAPLIPCLYGAGS